MIIGLWIEGQRFFLSAIKDDVSEYDTGTLSNAKCWLDDYFDGKRPSIDNLNISPIGSDFRQSVWRIISEIPYGEVISYGEIADRIARSKGIKMMSAQAVGNAVGHNPISIMIPCHRVVGSNGSLTGYAGGISIKEKLLIHEGVDMSRLFTPKKKDR